MQTIILTAVLDLGALWQAIPQSSTLFGAQSPDRDEVSSGLNPIQLPLQDAPRSLGIGRVLLAPAIEGNIMDSVYTTLAERAFDIQRASKQDSLTRVIIAFSGPPGSGKSTIAAEVVQRINTQTGRPTAVVLAMDGFHYSRAHLDTFPNRSEAYARRGAHWTFDAPGVLKLVKALHVSRNGPLQVITAPSFDHKSKDPVANALRIEPETEIVIIEGNWLLLDRDPWKQISDYVDDTWFVDVEPSLARHRVAARHIKAGIETNWEEAIARANNNDLLNGEEVRRNLIRPNVIVQSVDDKGS